MKRVTHNLVGLAAAAALTAGSALAQDPTFFRIGTGSAGGTYFPIGGLIAIAQSTTASVFNNTAVQNGELEAGLAAADVTRSMYLGEGKFDGKPHPNLRIVANLFPEDLHLVLPDGASLEGIGDLAGKRVGIAQAGSGTQVAVEMILEEWGLTRDDYDEAELNNSQSAERLADGQLDAYFYAAGWPVSAMVQLATTKGMELHSFSDADLAQINALIPAYIPSMIPAGVYEGVDYEVKTPAVSALLVVSADLSEDLVYGITGGVVERQYPQTARQRPCQRQADHPRYGPGRHRQLGRSPPCGGRKILSRSWLAGLKPLELEPGKPPLPGFFGSNLGFAQGTGRLGTRTCL